MRMLTLKEIQSLDNKGLVSGCRGVLKALYKRTTGGDGDKAWTLQSFQLGMAGGEIKVSVWNHDPLPEAWKGREICILAHEGDKGKSGVYAHDNEYQGRTTRQLRLTATGEVTLMGSSADQAKAPEPASKSAPARAAAPSNVTPPAASSAPASDDQETKAVKRRISGMMNLLMECFGAARFIDQEYSRRHNAVLPPAELGLNARTMFIEAKRQSLSLPPIKTPKKAEPAPVAKAAPTPAQNAADEPGDGVKY